MRKILTLSLVFCLGLGLTPAAVRGQAKSLTGKWTGFGINDTGVKSEAFLDLTVDDDGNLTGTWGCPDICELKIERGEQVTADVLRWESSTETHRWCVHATVKGKSLVLDTTCTWKENGKVKGGTEIDILICGVTKDKAALPVETPLGRNPPVALTTEMEALQGTWKLVSIEQGGHKMSAEEVKKFGADLMVIKGDMAPMMYDGKTYQGTIKVDPTQNPKTMHQIAPQGEPFQGAVCRCLYKLEGDTLTICNRVELGDVRPKEFTSKGMFAIYGWKREKK